MQTLKISLSHVGGALAPNEFTLRPKSIAVHKEVNMPPKIRDLISALKALGFQYQGSKESHRKYRHPDYPTPVILAGKPGDDAKPCQIKAVRDARKELGQ